METAPRTHRIDCSRFLAGEIRSLEVLEGPDRGRRLLLADHAVLGTARDVDLRLTDPAVSRRHLEIRRHAGHLELVDLGSLNGVYVEGQRILHGFVPTQARIRIGRTLLGPGGAAPHARGPSASIPRLVAHSRPMRELVALVRMLEGRRDPVLLLGPPGVGKRRVARVVHALGADADRPPLERSSIELGGLPRPAGTLELVVAPALDPGRARRVLEALLRWRPNRFVVTLDPEDGPASAALAAEIAGLGALEITVPTLQARPEDIPELVADLLEELGAPDYPLGPQALGRLQARPWPGQIAELKAYLHALVAGQPVPRPRRRTERIVGAHQPYKEARAAMIDAFEREYVAEILETSGGNITQAARRAGIDRVYLHRLMKKHGLGG